MQTSRPRTCQRENHGILWWAQGASPPRLLERMSQTVLCCVRQRPSFLAALVWAQPNGSSARLDWISRRDDYRSPAVLHSCRACGGTRAWPGCFCAVKQLKHWIQNLLRFYSNENVALFWSEKPKMFSRSRHWCHWSLHPRWVYSLTYWFYSFCTDADWL